MCVVEHLVFAVGWIECVCGVVWDERGGFIYVLLFPSSSISGAAKCTSARSLSELSADNEGLGSCMDAGTSCICSRACFSRRFLSRTERRESSRLFLPFMHRLRICWLFPGFALVAGSSTCTKVKSVVMVK